MKDWRDAASPAKWVKTATNNIANKEYWVPKYAVDPTINKELLGLEEIAEMPCEAIVEHRYTQRSVAELEAAAKEDSELAEYVSAKIRYPDWQREDIWKKLAWDREHGERVDRRYRRLRKRVREVGGGIQCREYRARPGISDASFTAYFEPLWDGTRGTVNGVWQHRDPTRSED